MYKYIYVYVKGTTSPTPKAFLDGILISYLI